MLTFEEAYEFTSKIGSHTSFELEECLAYFTLLMSLPVGSRIVEVGLEYGRSSSIALQVAKELLLSYVGIDPFMQENGDEAYLAWKRMADESGAVYALYKIRSSAFPVSVSVDVVLIDGDHSYEGVLADCKHFLPHVNRGGFAMFHDYHRESLPDVTNAVDEYMSGHHDWTYLDTAGTLAIWIHGPAGKWSRI